MDSSQPYMAERDLRMDRLGLLLFDLRVEIKLLRPHARISDQLQQQAEEIGRLRSE